VRMFFRWVNSTLLGHIAYYGSLFAVSESATSIYLNFTEDTLTLSWAIFTVIGCAFLGVMGAVVIWFVITLPRIKRKASKQ
jgi:hypothetical protein